MTSTGTGGGGVALESVQPQFSGSSLEVGRVLVKALAELGTLRRNFGNNEGNAALANAEDLLRQQAEVILAEGLKQELHESLGNEDVERLTMTSKALAYTRVKQRELVEHWDSQAHLKHNLMHNPTTEAARVFLNRRFGIPLAGPDQPGSPVRAAGVGLPNGVVKGLSASKPCVLPRCYRDNPFAPVPLHYVDREIKHGLYHLINRGIIPPFSNLTDTLTGEYNVLHARQSVLLPFHMQFVRPPEAAALDRVATAAMVPPKMDVLSKRSRLARTSVSAPHGPWGQVVNDEIDGSGQLSNYSLQARLSQAVAVPTSTGDAGSGGSTAREHARTSAGTLDAAAAGSGDAAEDGDRSAWLQVSELSMSPRPDVVPFEASAASGVSSVLESRTGDGVEPDADGALGAPGQERASGEVGSGEEVGGADGREYEELMDEHSHHHILIRKGVTIDETPEFASYHRTFAKLWPAIAELILQLEGICTQYAVPLATVDGKALAQLAAECPGGQHTPMEQLLACIVNIQEVAEILRQPGRRFQGPDGYNAAATVIQANARGFCARSRGKKHTAARHIQYAWRTLKLQEGLARRMHEARASREDGFAALQRRFRTEWDDIMTSHRIIVHVPSLTLTPLQRAAIPNVPLAENAQMARLCDVADPLCDVVYIAPFPVDDVVEEYWGKLLEVGGVESPASRFRIIHPENYSRLPERMPLTAKLLASPRALRRLQMIVQGRKAFIVPGVPGDSDINLAVVLDAPLLAAHPTVSRAISTKSGARAVFKGSRMNVAPGLSVAPVEGPLATGAQAEGGAMLNLEFAMKGGELQITDALPRADDVSGAGVSGDARASSQSHRKDADLCRQVAKAMIDAVAVKRWLIKIEDEDNGRGHAYFDVAKLQGAENVLLALAGSIADASASAASAGSRGAEDAASDVAGRQARSQRVIEDAKLLARHKLNVICLNNLRKVLKCVTPSVFPDYRAFIQAVRRRGAVVEAAAALTLGSPTVNMLIEPTGNVKVVSTMEQIFCPSYRVVGHSFPQASVVHSALYDAAATIGKSLASQGVMGHASIDFVVLRENGLLRMWATDLNLHPTQSLASFQLFDFLTAGEFNARKGTYTVTEDPDDASAPSTGAMNYEASRASRSEQGTGTSQRYFVSCESVHHPGLSMMNYGQLFHKCRAANKVFDMEERTGTTFSLLDSASAGVLTVLCSGHTLFDSLAEMSHALAFIDSSATEAAPNASSQASAFRATTSTLHYLTDRLAPLVTHAEGQVP